MMVAARNKAIRLVLIRAPTVAGRLCRIQARSPDAESPGLDWMSTTVAGRLQVQLALCAAALDVAVSIGGQARS